MVKSVPFARYLPYFATRSLTTKFGEFSACFLIDGTVFVGWEVQGVDVFGAANAALNRNNEILQRVLNTLPGDYYLQTEWELGTASYEDVINDFSARVSPSCHPVLVEQRQHRVLAMSKDESLVRGRIFYFLGKKRALPSLGLPTKSWFSRMFASSDNTLQGEDALRVAVDELAEVAQRLVTGLGAIGLKFAPLREEELLRRVHEVLNPNTSRHVPVSIVESDASLNMAGSSDLAMYRALTVREQLPLSDMTWSEDHFAIDEPRVLGRVLSLQRWPAVMGPDFLFGVQFASQTRLRLVSTIVATARELSEEKLTRTRNIVQALSAGHVRDHRAQVALEEHEDFLSRMVTHDQRIFLTSHYALVMAQTFEELDNATRDLKEAFANPRVGAVATIDSARQLFGFLNTLPGICDAPHRRVVMRSTENCANLMPYFQPSIGDELRQVVYATRQRGLRAVGFTERKASKPNTNVLVLGGSGSGKSFNVASVFEQACLAEGGPVLVIDVQGPEVSNYRTLCDVLDGSYTALASSDISFNPFMPIEALWARDDETGAIVRDQGHPRIDDNKLAHLAKLVCLMAVSNIESHHQQELCIKIARDCIKRAYSDVIRERKGRPPLLRDVVAKLAGYASPHEEYQALARQMHLQLETWIQNPSRARLLDRPSNYVAANRFQVYDFYGLEKDPKLASVLLLSVAFNIWSTLYTYPRETPKFVLFDECWKLITHPIAAGIVAELYRTGRKWGASTWAITQNLNDFLSSPIRSDLITNAATFILNQHAVDHERVVETLDLTPRQAGLFRSLEFRGGEYAELLLIEQAAREATVLRLQPTSFELWLNSSAAADVGFRKRVQRQLGVSMLEAIRICAQHFPRGCPHEPEKALASLPAKPNGRVRQELGQQDEVRA